jgi:hypothetical protein
MKKENNNKVKSPDGVQLELPFEELKKIADETNERIKRERPSHISATDLMRSMGIQVQEWR